MVRYLRPLAIGAVVFQLCVVVLTIPPGLSPIPLGHQVLSVLISLFNSLALTVLASTATLLTFLAGTLAIVASVQRSQRRWSVTFLVLLILFAYGPLFFAWLRMSRTPTYDPETFTFNPAAYYSIELIPQMIAMILAIVVLVYGFRYRQARNEFARSNAQ